MAGERGAPKVEARRTKLRDGGVTTTYTVRWFTPSGARKRKSFRRRDEAELYALELRKLQLVGGTLAVAQDTPAGPTLDEFWPAYREDLAQRVGPETVRGYEQTYDRYVRVEREVGDRPDLRPMRPQVAAVPRLGAVRLSDLTTRQLSLTKTRYLQAGLGAETVRRILLLLQAVCRYAVELDEISVNPVREVRKPRQEARPAVHPLLPLDVERVRAAFVATGDAFSWMLVGVMAYAGLRPGEAIALECRHVRERTLLIEQAIRDGRVKLQKTGRSYRSVDLLDPLRDDLAAYFARVGPLPGGKLFPSGQLEWMAEDDWRNWRKRKFEPAVASAGLPRCRPYDLRHSFASLLIREQRYSIADIAEQLGHQATMTLDVYGHVFAEHRGAPTEAAGDLIRAARTAAGSALR